MTMMDEQKSAQRDAMCRDEQTAGSAPEGALSRRSFLAGATIVGAAAFGLGLGGCAVQRHRTLRHPSGRVPVRQPVSQPTSGFL